MTTSTITKPEPADIPRLLDLLEQQYTILHSFYPQFYHPWTPELRGQSEIFLKEIVESGSGAFVAKVEDKVAGLITFATVPRGHFDTVAQEFTDVTELIVDSEYRSLGIGNSLIEAVKEKVKEDGITLMRVVVSAKNERGIEFYKRSGFEIRELNGFMEL